ncbi:hypothetical protein M0R45_001429 [Rubus argutus]|uniref:Protein kinase domain-containing protein n=1 Tax=Rubus argutus TaxID=59490 RepID=A0AAW1VLJ9_RUBAR
MQQQQKAADVTEAMDSGNNAETVPEPIPGNGIQVAALDGGDALKSVFGMLFDAVLEVEDKAVMFKGPLGDLKSTLDSLKPLIEEIAQRNTLEVKFLGRLSHPNLVKLLGYCYEKKKALLVYEFVQRGSLDTHLFRRIPDEEPLSWGNRFKIAMGAARGLTFLHNLQIIHRHVKPSNLLLDEDYNPKISGFSLAHWGPVDGESYVSTRICGTFGYMDPEYAITGHLSVKSDVYSFGVVLLEILTGLKAVDKSRHSDEEIHLVHWAIRLLSDETELQTIMDTQIEGQYSPQEALQTTHLALKCLQRDPESRPSMKEVVEELACIQAMKENPKQFDPLVEEAALRATAARLKDAFRLCLYEEVEGSGVESDGSLEGR